MSLSDKYLVFNVKAL